MVGINVFKVVFLVACIAVSTSSFQEISESPEIVTELTRSVIRQFILRFNDFPSKNAIEISEGGEIQDITFPVLPPLADPMFLNASELVIPEESGFPIFGNSSSWNSNVTGLSQLVDLFTLSPTPDNEFLFSYVIDFPEVLIVGEHDTLMTIVSLATDLRSSGAFSIDFKNATIGLALKVKILLENAIEVTGVSIDLGFDDLEVFTTETTIGEEPVDWDEFNEQIVERFHELWEMAKPNIEVLVEFALNLVVADCKFTDLITGNVTCITGGGEEPTLLSHF